MSPRGGVPEQVSAQEENLGTHSTAQIGPKFWGHSSVPLEMGSSPLLLGPAAGFSPADLSSEQCRTLICQAATLALFWACTQRACHGPTNCTRYRALGLAYARQSPGDTTALFRLGRFCMGTCNFQQAYPLASTHVMWSSNSACRGPL